MSERRRTTYDKAAVTAAVSFIENSPRHEFWRRIELWEAHFHYQHINAKAALSLNDSIKFARRDEPSSFGVGRADHRDFEIMTVLVASQLAKADGSIASLIPETYLRSARHRLGNLRVKEGRQSTDDHLIYHVHAYMAMCSETLGVQLTARKNRGTDYEPHFPDELGHIMVSRIQQIDQTITVGSLAKIVRAATADGAIVGKRFVDYFLSTGGMAARAATLRSLNAQAHART